MSRAETAKPDIGEQLHKALSTDMKPLNLSILNHPTC